MHACLFGLKLGYRMAKSLPASPAAGRLGLSSVPPDKKNEKTPKLVFVYYNVPTCIISCAHVFDACPVSVLMAYDQRHIK